MSRDLSDLKFDKVKQTILGNHVLYQQYHDGRPVTGAWVKIDIDQHGRVYNVLNTLIPSAVAAKSQKASGAKAETAPPVLTKEQTKRIALNVAGATAKVLTGSM